MDAILEDDDALVDEWLEEPDSPPERQFGRYATLGARSALSAFEGYVAARAESTLSAYNRWARAWESCFGGPVAVNVARLQAFVTHCETTRRAHNKSFGASSFCNMLSAVAFLADKQYCFTRHKAATVRSAAERESALAFLDELEDPRGIFRTLCEARARAFDPFDDENWPMVAKYAPGSSLTYEQARGVCLRLFKRPNMTTGLREYKTFTQCIASLHRGDEVFRARLAQYGAVERVRVDGRECIAIGYWVPISKTNLKGKPEYSYYLPHVDVALCPVVAQAFWFFHKYHMTGVLPSPAELRTTYAFAGPDGEPLTGGARRKVLRSAYVAEGVEDWHLWHACRHLGEHLLESDPGIQSHHIDLRGRWANNVKTSRYGDPRNPLPLKVMAGVSTRDVYDPTWRHQPPPDVSATLWPEAEAYRRQAQNDRILAQFYEMVIFLRTVLMQAFPLLRQQAPDAPVWCDRFFGSFPEWERAQLAYVQGTRSAEDTIDALQIELSRVQIELRRVQRNRDHLAIICKEQAAALAARAKVAIPFTLPSSPPPTPPLLGTAPAAQKCPRIGEKCPADACNCDAVLAAFKFPTQLDSVDDTLTAWDESLQRMQAYPPGLWRAKHQDAYRRTLAVVREYERRAATLPHRQSVIEEMLAEQASCRPPTFKQYRVVLQKRHKT